MNNYWLDGIMGVVVGDALGCPVQFHDRADRKKDPVEDMRGYGVFKLPEGSWTDDSSLTLAALDSLINMGQLDLQNMMDAFVLWLNEGEYTPYGYSFDVGFGTENAINKYIQTGDVFSCGGTSVRDNGNGSLMRIMSICLYCYSQEKKGAINREIAMEMVHAVAGLTHNHNRGKIACGIYYLMVCHILDGMQSEGMASISEHLQQGIFEAFLYYGMRSDYKEELVHYQRLLDLEKFRSTDEAEIKSSGYVVDSIEAAVWSLLNADDYKSSTLTSVNLGWDTDTIAAIAGGLAGLYYGVDDIPTDWRAAIKRREWIEELCATAKENKCPK